MTLASTPTRIGVTRAAQDRVALLVVPPQATPAAAGIAMAMAADAANSAYLAHQSLAR